MIQFSFIKVANKVIWVKHVWNSGAKSITIQKTNLLQHYWTRNFFYSFEKFIYFLNCCNLFLYQIYHITALQSFLLTLYLTISASDDYGALKTCHGIYIYIMDKIYKYILSIIILTLFCLVKWLVILSGIFYVVSDKLFYALFHLSRSHSLLYRSDTIWQGITHPQFRPSFLKGDIREILLHHHQSYERSFKSSRFRYVYLVREQCWIFLGRGSRFLIRYVNLNCFMSAVICGNNYNLSHLNEKKNH